MPPIGLVVLLALLVCGYPLYLRYREWEMEKRIKRMGQDKDSILAEMEAQIQQTNKEAEFWKQNRGKW